MQYLLTLPFIITWPSFAMHLSLVIMVMAITYHVYGYALFVGQLGHAYDIAFE